MNSFVVFKNARCAVIERKDGSIFESEKSYRIYVNGVFYKETNRTVVPIYGLEPETEYTIRIEGEKWSEVSFRTDYEFVSLNVCDFGAKGDGIQDDTIYIQAAIMACPPNSRILFPAGVYHIKSLFLKDNINIELEKGAILSADTDRNNFPIFKGVYESFDKELEYQLGTWEGDMADMFTGILTGAYVKNAVIYGEGTIDGNASRENWWFEPKKIRIAARPRMVFLNHCEHITMIGLTIKNSPSWNIHPYFSNHLLFSCLTILSPKDSPNTDGIDPESCSDVNIIGTYFSVGDDCIAIKSGKIKVGAKYKTPSQQIQIRQCCMRDGHGSITLGSEMAGGIKQITAKECLFLHTDRGLRIKTRRGRGKDAVIDEIVFEQICMDHVMTPFVVNSFYFCDSDGHSDYVQCKDSIPVDERTPSINMLAFREIEAKNCHVAAAFFYGLPEQKIKKIEMNHVLVTYAEEARGGKPAMMDGIEDNICRMGIYANNIETLKLHDITVIGQEGEDIIVEQVDNFTIS